MTSLITLSHGSRHPKAVAGIEALTQRAAALADVAHWQCAHLEFNESDLATAAQQLAARGETEAVVVPLLFTEGYHHRVDVPEAIAAAEEASGLRLLRSDSLGTGADMAQVLAQRAGCQPQCAPMADHLIIYSVGSSNLQTNQAIARLAVRVSDLTGVSTSVAFATRGGREDVAKQARIYSSVRVLPLFVTEGLLLDLLAEAPAHVDSPLGVDLAGIVSHRFVHAAGLPYQTRQLVQIGR